jgi:peptide deformylase
MALLRVRVYPDPDLRRKAEPVVDFGPELRRLVADLWETMEANDGVGLAAPQVGVPLRLAVIAWKGRRFTLINPEILQTEGSEVGEEGCLSFPGIFEKVRRPDRVLVRARDERGEPFEVRVEGFLARAFCHEIDHLDGRLLIDHLSSLKREFVRKRLKRILTDPEGRR